MVSKMLIKEIIQNAYREMNLISIEQPPTDAEFKEGETVLKSIWSSLFESIIGSYLTDIPMEEGMYSSYDPRDSEQAPRMDNSNILPVNSRVLMNVNYPKEVYLPTNPHDGALIGVISYPGSDALTLHGNSRMFSGGLKTVLVEPENSGLWMYRSDLGVWESIAWPASIDDEMPLPPVYNDYFICALARRLAERNALTPTPSVMATEAALLKDLTNRYNNIRQVKGSFSRTVANYSRMI